MLLLFFSKNLNYIDDLFENNDKMKIAEDLKAKLGLNFYKKYYWRQKNYALESLVLEKKGFLNSRELYNIQLTLNVEKLSAQTYFEKTFQNPELEWKDM